jgi:transcriptional regulator with AAA-type ATPase domain
MPLIAYAVINGLETGADSSAMVAKLLCAGADPKTIPVDMWLDGHQGLGSLSLSDRPAWCTLELHRLLATAFTVTHIYLLRRANEAEVSNELTLQMVKGTKMSKLLKIGHTVIGQQTACLRVLDRVFAHVALKRSEPLLLAFAGPAGHGKTELAENLGTMISAETVSINCAEIRTSWGLFGSESGYIGSQDGTILNNFLVKNNGRHSVIFLDEFDKTDSRVVEALLTLCEKGR